MLRNFSVSQKRLLILSLSLLILLVLGRNFALWAQYCHHNYDIGIFMEAIQKFSLNAGNPYLDSRQLTYFNDHWEPITFIVGNIFRVFSFLGLGYFSMSVELLFLIVAAAPLLWLVKKQEINSGLATLLILVLWLSRDTLQAFFYPIHATTWAVLGLMMLNVQLYRMRQAQEARFSFTTWLAILLFLSIFQEQFSAVGVGVSIAFLIVCKKQRLQSLLLLLICVINMWFSFRGRSLLFGPLWSYAWRVKTDFASWLQIYEWNLNQLKTVVLFFLSLLPLVILIKKYGRIRWQMFLIFLGAYSPLLLGRILSNSFGGHYNLALVAMMVGLVLVLVDKSVIVKEKTLWWSFVFLIAFSNNRLRNWSEAVVRNESRCVPSSSEQNNRAEIINNRKVRLDKLLYELKSNALEAARAKNILVSGNLLPNFVASLPKVHVFQLGAVWIDNVNEVDEIIIEKGAWGDNYPLSPEQVGLALTKIKQNAELKVVEEDDSIFHARGHFSLESLKEFYSEKRFSASGWGK